MRTLSTMTATLDFGLVAIRIVPIALGLDKIRLRVEVTDIRLSFLVILSVSVPTTPTVPELSVGIIHLSKLLLEEGGDVVCDTLEFLVAVSLCGLEVTCYMTPNEAHRNGV